MTNRVVALVDMDCFYCQVENRLEPRLVGKPMAVVQYNSWKGGGIIAVNYEARAFGVTRNMRGDEAKAKCPDIILVSVPEARGKADLTKYREAGGEVIQVFKKFDGAIVERASVDEAYIDLTQIVEERLLQLAEKSVTSDHLSNTHLAGKHDLKTWLDSIYREARSDDIRLAVGAMIVEEMRARVFDETQFRCSAGIAHNKMLGKLACGINKPNKQTILSHQHLQDVFSNLKLTKLRGLGGKLGDSVVQELHCETVGQLGQISLQDIRKKFDEKTSQWLHDISHGRELDPVKERELPKSIGCSKNFLGPKMLDTVAKVEYWVGQLVEELGERVRKDRIKNHRVAKGLTVSASLEDGSHVTRSGALLSYDTSKITKQALTLLASLNKSAGALTPDSEWTPKLKNIGVSATKFEEEGSVSSSENIKRFFSTKPQSLTKPEQSEVSVEELVPSLDAFDESIIPSLPLHIQQKVKDRLEMLREEARQSVEMVQCDQCPQLVSPFELPEHLDFHFAQKIQSEMRQGSSSAEVKTVVLPDRSSTMTSKKRKKQTNDHGLASDDGCKRQKNILNFFKKS